MSNQHEIREQVTAKIVAALEKDLLPWRPMWGGGSNGQHANALTKKAYRGVNPLLLQLHAAEHGFQSNWWATFNQWKQMGCYVNRRPDHVPPGQWGATLAVYIPITRQVEEPEDGDDDEEETIWILKKFTVFNAEQACGPAAEQYQVVETPDTKPDFEPAETLIQASGAEIHFGGDRAFYRLPTPKGSWPDHTDGDFIQVPPKSCFIGGACYTTMLHELAHWSEVRVGWDREKGGYPLGELVAEIASCYLAAELGVPNSEPLENHAAYLKSWLEAMKNDANYIFKASRQASKVCDFLLGFVRQPETKPDLVEAA